jgi:hypothetical protein
MAQQFAVHMLKKKECNKYSGFPRSKKTWEISGHGFQDLGSQLWGLGNFRTWFSGLGISILGPGFHTGGFT